MTPKEKAKDLFYKMQLDWACDSCHNYWAKECALIAVDELINTEYQTVSKLLEVIQKNKIRLVISLNKDYWQEVKQEIEKL